MCTQQCANAIDTIRQTCLYKGVITDKTYDDTITDEDIQRNLNSLTDPELKRTRQALKDIINKAWDKGGCSSVVGNEYEDIFGDNLQPDEGSTNNAENNDETSYDKSDGACCDLETNVGEPTCCETDSCCTLDNLSECCLDKTTYLQERGWTDRYDGMEKKEILNDVNEITIIDNPTYGWRYYLYVSLPDNPPAEGNFIANGSVTWAPEFDPRTSTIKEREAWAIKNIEDMRNKTIPSYKIFKNCDDKQCSNRNVRKLMQ